MSTGHRHRSWMWLGVVFSLGLVALIAALLWTLFLAPQDVSAGWEARAPPLTLPTRPFR